MHTVNTFTTCMYIVVMFCLIVWRNLHSLWLHFFILPQAVRETSGFTERVHLFLDLIVSYEVRNYRGNPSLKPHNPFTGPLLEEGGDSPEAPEGSDEGPHFTESQGTLAVTGTPSGRSHDSHVMWK